jgi:hypothetical protein
MTPAESDHSVRLMPNPTLAFPIRAFRPACRNQIGTEAHRLVPVLGMSRGPAHVKLSHCRIDCNLGTAGILGASCI